MKEEACWTYACVFVRVCVFVCAGMGDITGLLGMIGENKEVRQREAEREIHRESERQRAEKERERVPPHTLSLTPEREKGANISCYWLVPRA